MREHPLEVVSRVAEELREQRCPVATKDTHRLELPLRQLRVAHREILPPVVRVQTALHPWVAYGIVPLFALANAGVSLTGVDLSAGRSAIRHAGRGACPRRRQTDRCDRLRPGLRCGWAGAGWHRAFRGAASCLVGLLAGIGFTMSIFIAMLAFTDGNLLGAAKLGVLVGSLVAAMLGLAWGVAYVRRLRRETDGVASCDPVQTLGQSRIVRPHANGARAIRSRSTADSKRRVGSLSCVAVALGSVQFLKPPRTRKPARPAATATMRL